MRRLQDHRPFWPISMDDYLSEAWTVNEVARHLYPGIAFDTALPQPFVNECRDRLKVEARGAFVWGYPGKEYRNRNLNGLPLPLVLESWAKVLHGGLGRESVLWLMEARMTHRNRQR